MFSSVTHLFYPQLIPNLQPHAMQYKKVIVNIPLTALQATPHKANPAAEVHRAESQERHVSGPDWSAGALHQPEALELSCY